MSCTSSNIRRGIAGFAILTIAAACSSNPPTDPVKTVHPCTLLQPIKKQRHLASLRSAPTGNATTGCAVGTTTTDFDIDVYDKVGISKVRGPMSVGAKITDRTV
ncbi:MAG: hypothetical protein J2P17_08540, partial [Mycobacterium sp.]|nr:hypothetical protein [Mycobacterium sp.]